MSQIDYNALKGFTPDDGIYPEGWYQGEVKKINPTESGKGITAIVMTTDYQGKKEEGVKALGKEFSCYIGTEITDKTPEFLKVKNQRLLSNLLKACNLDPANNPGPEEFIGKLVMIGLVKSKDKLGRATMTIDDFDRA